MTQDAAFGHAGPARLPPRAAFYTLFAVSGFAGLIYESIWTHYLKLFLGHAAYAQSLVLAVFMGGMALGAALAGRRSTRLANPLAGYALVEAVVGLLALAFHELFVATTDWAYVGLLPALGDASLALGAKLLLSCALILPQSILLGATFPLMSAGLLRAHPAASGESMAMLYFTNSLGAAAGVLVSGFVLIAWVGLPGTLRSAGVINLCSRPLVWLLARPVRARAARGARRQRIGRTALLLAVAFFTGLASFIYEISWIRMLALVLGASTHSFELMLSTFILGLALGGLAIRRRADRLPRPMRALGWIQLAMGLLALATLPLYHRTFDAMALLMDGLSRSDAGYLLFNLAGQGLSAFIMLPATFCAGMTLPLITVALLRDGAGEAAIGRVYAANTLGAIAGVLFALHIGLPVLGLKGAVIAGALVDALLGLALLRHTALKRGRPCRRRGGERRAVPGARTGLRARHQQDDRRRVPPRRPRSLARRRSAVRRGRQDRHGAPGRLSRGGEPAHQRQVRRLDREPRTPARHRRNHHGAHRRAAARAQARSARGRGDRYRHRPDHPHAAAEPRHGARRDGRDRIRDGRGRARLSAAQHRHLRRSDAAGS